MPTALIKKLASEYNIAVDDLEKDWSRSKEIAGEKFKDSDSAYWPYVMGVFKRMVDNKYGIDVSESSVPVLSTSGQELVFDDGSPEAWSGSDDDVQEDITGLDSDSDGLDSDSDGLNSDDTYISESAKSKFQKEVDANNKKFKADVRANNKKFKNDVRGKQTKPKAPTPKVKAVPPAKKTSTKNPIPVVKKSAPRGKKALKEGEFPAWWVKLSEYGRSTYLNKHPNSGFAKSIKKMTPQQRKKAMKVKQNTRDTSREEPPEDEVDGLTNTQHNPVIPEGANENGKVEDPNEEVSEDELKTYDNDEAEKDDEEKESSRFHDYHPSDHTSASIKQRIKEYGHNAVRKAQHAFRVGRHGVKMGIMKEKYGLRSIDKMLRGGKLSDDEKAGAKRVAKHAGVLLLGALGAVAMFTPLAPFASVLGDEFFTNVSHFFRGSSESSVAESEDDEDAGFSSDDAPSAPLNKMAGNLTDKMQEWLMSQDPEKLARQLAEKYPQFVKEK